MVLTNLAQSQLCEQKFHYMCTRDITSPPLEILFIALLLTCHVNLHPWPSMSRTHHGPITIWVMQIIRNKTVKALASALLHEHIQMVPGL
jgi:hypothetical protein